MDEVRRLGALKDSEINTAKKTLAYEVTKLIHGQDEADKARQAAEALFGGSGDLDNVPTTTFSLTDLAGKRLIDILPATGLTASIGEGRRLIAGGGLYIGDEKVEDPNLVIDLAAFKDNTLLLRKGKKTYHRLVIE